MTEKVFAPNSCSAVSDAGFFAGRTIAALSEGLRRGDWTAVELVDLALGAIERLNPALNAFVLVDDRARTAAARMDAELADGLDRGLLHGIPVGVKDLIDVAGLSTSAGSSIYGGHVATEDAACAQRLVQAGAVIVGKTVLHEFAYGATGDRSTHGPSRNPHDPSRMSGGSSGGSAVAVAAGMVPLTLGTDTAGSVRVPASLCGVGGFKPAYDAIPTSGVHALAHSLDHVGVFAWSAEEAIRVGSLLSGDADIPHPVLTGDIRLGWIDPSSLGAVDPAVLRATRTSFESVASELNATVIELPSVIPDEIFHHFSTIQASEAYALHHENISRFADAIDQEVLQRLQWGEQRRAWQYLQSMTVRARLADRVAGLWSDVDVVAMPTTPFTAPEIGQRSLEVAGRPVEVRAALLSLTSPWNLTGTPAVSVPLATQGLPVGFQLIAPRSSTSLLRVLAREIQAHTVARV